MKHQTFIGAVFGSLVLGMVAAPSLWAIDCDQLPGSARQRDCKWIKSLPAEKLVGEVLGAGAESLEDRPLGKCALGLGGPSSACQYYFRAGRPTGEAIPWGTQTIRHPGYPVRPGAPSSDRTLPCEGDPSCRASTGCVQAPSAFSNFNPNERTNNLAENLRNIVLSAIADAGNPCLYSNAIAPNSASGGAGILNSDKLAQSGEFAINPANSNQVLRRIGRTRDGHDIFCPMSESEFPRPTFEQLRSKLNGIKKREAPAPAPLCQALRHDVLQGHNILTELALNRAATKSPLSFVNWNLATSFLGSAQSGASSSEAFSSLDLGSIIPTISNFSLDELRQASGSNWISAANSASFQAKVEACNTAISKLANKAGGEGQDTDSAPKLSALRQEMVQVCNQVSIASVD